MEVNRQKKKHHTATTMNSCERVGNGERQNHIMHEHETDTPMMCMQKSGINDEVAKKTKTEWKDQKKKKKTTKELKESERK